MSAKYTKIPITTKLGQIPAAPQGNWEKTEGDKDLEAKGRRDKIGRGRGGVLLLYFHPAWPVAKDVHERIHESGLESDGRSLLSARQGNGMLRITQKPAQGCSQQLH